MGFQIDGEQWQPLTTGEHATKWLESINALLEENNVVDSDGNVIKLSKSFANALYLQILAGANRLAINDEKLQAGINSFNIELCDDQQIENLLPIASITRNPGSYSTLILTATASEDGVCTIPAGTKAPFGDVNFVVSATAVIQPGTTQNIATVCDTIGAYSVLVGEITSFENQIPNLESVRNNVSSVPGNAAETTASLRQRIIKGQTIPYSLDGVKLALEELTGINHAKIYFNFNTSETITLEGNVVIQPRTAYIVINGSSDQIAETYAKYMNAPTQNDPNGSSTGTQTTVNVDVTAGDEGCTVPENTSFVYDGMTFTNASEVEIAANQTETILFTAVDVGRIVIPEGAITAFEQTISGVEEITNDESTPGVNKTCYSQDYTTSSGQQISIKYDIADESTVYVKICIAAGAENGSEVYNQLKRDLIASSASWELGQTVTSLLTSKPFINCLYTDVAYTQVSSDGTTWVNLVETPVNAIPRVSDSTIIIEEL